VTGNSYKSCITYRNNFCFGWQFKKVVVYLCLISHIFVAELYLGIQLQKGFFFVDWRPLHEISEMIKSSCIQNVWHVNFTWLKVWLKVLNHIYMYWLTHILWLVTLKNTAKLVSIINVNRSKSSSIQSRLISCLCGRAEEIKVYSQIATTSSDSLDSIIIKRRYYC